MEIWFSIWNLQSRIDRDVSTDKSFVLRKITDLSLHYSLFWKQFEFVLFNNLASSYSYSSCYYTILTVNCTSICLQVLLLYSDQYSHSRLIYLKFLQIKAGDIRTLANTSFLLVKKNWSSEIRLHAFKMLQVRVHMLLLFPFLEGLSCLFNNRYI